MKITKKVIKAEGPILKELAKKVLEANCPAEYRVLPDVFENLQKEGLEYNYDGASSREIFRNLGISMVTYICGSKIIPYDPELAVLEIKEQEQMYGLED